MEPGPALRTPMAWLALLLLAPVTARAADVYGSPDAPLVAEVLGTKIHTNDPEEMKYVILRKLTDRYATEKKIEVGEAEIDRYVESMRRSMAADRNEKQARLAEIDGFLAAKDLDAAKRKSLTEERNGLAEFLKASAPAEDAESADAKASERKIAEAFIRQWKINRALHREYGGRIGYQQGGPEPLDAYHRFLEAEQKAGAFRILKPDFVKPFWHYYVTDSLHDFYPVGSKEEQRALTVPWWESDMPRP